MQEIVDMWFSFCDLDMMKLLETGWGCLFHGHCSQNFKKCIIILLNSHKQFLRASICLMSLFTFVPEPFHVQMKLFNHRYSSMCQEERHKCNTFQNVMTWWLSFVTAREQAVWRICIISGYCPKFTPGLLICAYRKIHPYTTVM